MRGRHAANMTFDVNGSFGAIESQERRSKPRVQARISLASGRLHELIPSCPALPPPELLASPGSVGDPVTPKVSAVP